MLSLPIRTRSTRPKQPTPSVVRGTTSESLTFAETFANSWSDRIRIWAVVLSDLAVSLLNNSPSITKHLTPSGLSAIALAASLIKTKQNDVKTIGRIVKKKKEKKTIFTLEESLRQNNLRVAMYEGSFDYCYPFWMLSEPKTKMTS